ncbi:MAG: hypothetical protein HRT35_08360 [Algicola sp.]|nr:hypothetical protein [Algicola sp.]
MRPYSTQDFQQIVKLIQAYESNASLLSAFLPVLEEFHKLLKAEYATAVEQDTVFTNVDAVQFDTFADMLHVIAYNFVNAPQINEPVLYANLVEIYNACENIYRSFAQYARGTIDETAGKFFASQANMQELVDASQKMLKEHKPGEPITFVQVA